MSGEVWMNQKFLLKFPKFCSIQQISDWSKLAIYSIWIKNYLNSSAHSIFRSKFHFKKFRRLVLLFMFFRTCHRHKYPKTHNTRSFTIFVFLLLLTVLGSRDDTRTNEFDTRCEITRLFVIFMPLLVVLMYIRLRWVTWSWVEQANYTTPTSIHNVTPLKMLFST